MTVKGTVCGTSGSVGILREPTMPFFRPNIIVPACKPRRKLELGGGHSKHQFKLVWEYPAPILRVHHRRVG